MWQRFDLALQNNHTHLAEVLKTWLTPSEQSIAKLWLQIHAKPELINAAEFKRQPIELKKLIFADAVRQMAAKNPSFACLIWDTQYKQYSLDDAHRRRVEHDLALALAKEKANGAFARLMKVTQVDEDIKEWRLRSALIETNWDHVLAAIASLSADDQLLPKWQYWQARALWQQNQQEAALQVFHKLANKRDYYGFLAADFADLGYQLEDHPISTEPSALNQLLNSETLKSVQELRYFGREHEAQAQWWYFIKRIDKAQIALSAKIAQQWQWHPVDMFTIVKAEQWDDVNLRFPILYQQNIMENAILNTLDPSLVFGLIRQESAFASEASSAVGAKGLMQIMPATASQIAQELHETWESSASLLNPDLNIRYGTYYYSKLVRRFDGHAALAAAAYNAGPKRVASWLPEKTSVPADIWIETIPFKETRKYVSSVLTYAIIYQQRLQKNSFKIRDFMPDVSPLKNLS